MKIIKDIFIKLILPLIQLAAIFLIMDLFKFWNKENTLTFKQAHIYSGLCLLIVYVTGFFIIFKSIKKNYTFYLTVQIVIGFIYIYAYLLYGTDNLMVIN